MTEHLHTERQFLLLCRRAYEQDRIGHTVFTGLYVLVNIGIMTEAAFRWHALHQTILNREGGKILSPFGPMAKTFGQVNRLQMKTHLVVC